MQKQHKQGYNTLTAQSIDFSMLKLIIKYHMQWIDEMYAQAGEKEQWMSRKSDYCFSSSPRITNYLLMYELTENIIEFIILNKGKKKGTYYAAFFSCHWMINVLVHHPSFPFIPINLNLNTFLWTKLDKLTNPTHLIISSHYLILSSIMPRI